MRARESELAELLTGKIEARFGKLQPNEDVIQSMTSDPMIQALLRARMIESIKN